MTPSFPKPPRSRSHRSKLPRYPMQQVVHSKQRIQEHPVRQIRQQQKSSKSSKIHQHPSHPYSNKHPRQLEQRTRQIPLPQPIQRRRRSTTRSHLPWRLLPFRRKHSQQANPLYHPSRQSNKSDKSNQRQLSSHRSSKPRQTSHHNNSHRLNPTRAQRLPKHLTPRANKR